jgi:hypothetical protein
VRECRRHQQPLAHEGHVTKKEATVAISIKTEATVKIPDVGQMEKTAYDEAHAELLVAYPQAIPLFTEQEYNSGEYWFTFDVSGAVPTREMAT